MINVVDKLIIITNTKCYDNIENITKDYKKYSCINQ